MVLLILTGIAQLVVLVLLLGAVAEALAERQKSAEQAIRLIEDDTIRSMVRVARHAGDVIDGQHGAEDRP
jgi:hypothetical protein